MLFSPVSLVLCSLLIIKSAYGFKSASMWPGQSGESNLAFDWMVGSSQSYRPENIPAPYAPVSTPPKYMPPSDPSPVKQQYQAYSPTLKPAPPAPPVPVSTPPDIKPPEPNPQAAPVGTTSGFQPYSNPSPAFNITALSDHKPSYGVLPPGVSKGFCDAVCDMRFDYCHKLMEYTGSLLFEAL
jgi:hypothetical protein